MIAVVLMIAASDSWFFPAVDLSDFESWATSSLWDEKSRGHNKKSCDVVLTQGYPSYQTVS